MSNDEDEIKSNNVYSGEHSDLNRSQLKGIQPDPIVDENSGDEYLDDFFPIQGEEDLYLRDSLPTPLEKGNKLREVQEELRLKEKECERLKKIIQLISNELIDDSGNRNKDSYEPPFPDGFWNISPLVEDN